VLPKQHFPSGLACNPLLGLEKKMEAVIDRRRADELLVVAGGSAQLR